MIGRVFRKFKLMWRLLPFVKVKKDSRALRWAIIGTGYMSATFARAINESRRDILYAIVSRDFSRAMKFAKIYGAKKAYGNYDEMLFDPEVDVVYIATPVECHFNHIEMCLKAGKNVLCEKPLTLTAKEAESLFTLAAEKGISLMEGMWTLCLPTMRKCKEWLESGVIGQLRFIRADINKRVSYDHIRKHHGVLYDYGIYCIAFMQFISNQAARITTVVKHLIDGNVLTDMSACFQFDGCQGVLNIMSSLNAPSKALIVGEQGSIEFESQFNRTNIIKRYDANGVLREICRYKYSCEGFEYELNEFHNAVVGEQKKCLNVISAITLSNLKIVESLQDAN